MDFLNSQSDTQSQMSNCFALDEITSQEDYLMQDSNPQTTQSMKNNFTGNISSTIQKNYNLEVINEESNFSPIQSQINSNNTLRNIIKKKYKLSQQIDNLEIEKKNSEKISVQNNNNSLNYQKNNFDGSLTEKLSNLNQEFVSKIDVFVNNGLNVLENSKKDYCNLVDNYKNNFLKNVNFIKSLLVTNIENVIQEEEKYSIIDQRMNQLFNEMINLMNDIQGFVQKK